MTKLIKILIALYTILALSSCQKESKQVEVNIAIASSLLPMIDKIQTSFNQEHPTCKISYNSSSSGQIYQQIINNAPFDIFLSADAKHPKLLGEKIQGSEVFFYASGSLLFWHQEHKDVRAEDKIIIADPSIAPYGAAAMKFLELNNYDIKKENILFTNKASQIITFIKHGNFNHALLAATAKEQIKEIGGSFEVINNKFEEINHFGIILQPSNTCANLFKTWLTDAQKGQKIIDSLIN